MNLIFITNFEIDNFEANKDLIFTNLFHYLPSKLIQIVILRYCSNFCDPTQSKLCSKQILETMRHLKIENLLETTNINI